MSMYQIEDLVEASVHQLCRTVSDPYQLGNDIHYLYEFQDQFDCSFTHFRLLRELLDCGFMIPIQPQDHPLYAEKQECFARLVQENFGYTPGPAGGYWCGVIEGVNGGQFVLNKFFCDYGSPLWGQLVEAGKLTGETARPQLPFNPYELVLRVLRQAAVGEDSFVFYYWYSLFPMLIEFMGDAEDATDEIKEELKSLLCCPEVFSPLKGDSGMAPCEDDYLDDAFGEEWFAPYFEWCKSAESDPQQLVQQITDLFRKGEYRATMELAEKGIRLKLAEEFCYLFWASSLVTMQVREMIPFEPEINQKAIQIFRRSLEYQEGEAAIQSMYYYLALASLAAKEFEAAENAVSKVKLIFEQNPALLKDYRNLEKKWWEHTN